MDREQEEAVQRITARYIAECFSCGSEPRVEPGVALYESN